MMEELISGMPASKLFRALMQEDGGIDVQKLGEIIMTEFPDISPGASLAIRRWLNPTKGLELLDEDIDGMILYYLNDAGYLCQPSC